MQYGQRAKEILLELKRCDYLPAYNVGLPAPARSNVFLSLRYIRRRSILPRTDANAIHVQDAAIRDISREIDSLYSNIYETLSVQGEKKDISTMTGLTVFHQCLLRDKRCLLSYLYWRTKRVVQLRWETGRQIPAELKANMGPTEIEFFQSYDDILGEYMRSVNLDLTANVTPPKEPFIEVRALQDCGEIVSSDGTSIRLDKNTTNLVRREDVEHLIKQGYLEQLS